MSTRKPHEVPDFIAMAKKIKDDSKRYAETFCLQWFDDSFQNEGFTDASFLKWDSRNKPDKREGGAILTNTTYLRKSLELMSHSTNTLTFGTNVPYAALHNNGGRLRAVQYVRAHHSVRKDKRVQVKAHSRKVDLKYPKRQFIGHSEKMMDNLDQWLFNQIVK